MDAGTAVEIIVGVVLGIGGMYGKQHIQAWRYKRNGYERRDGPTHKCMWNPTVPPQVQKVFDQFACQHEELIRIMAATYKLNRAIAAKQGVDVGFYPENPREI